MNQAAVASTVLMIRPARFAANTETAGSNGFQRQTAESPDVASAARAEFDTAVDALILAGVRVEVIDDTLEPWKPDAVFPNNWVSFHADGTVCLYPMLAPNRRPERRSDILEILGRERGYRISQVDDLSTAELNGRYLEGTGSLVLDRAHRIAYACLSARTDEQLVHEWCERYGYEPLLFHAADTKQAAIYHTNVMMCVGDRFAVVCLDAIADPDERESVSLRLNGTGHRIVPISIEQMGKFAGNMLLLKNRDGERTLLMSSRAEQSLMKQQRDSLLEFARIVSSPLNTIEDCAGGSMRCMIAELFLPRR
jgi:hypothetical protein